MPNLDNPKQFAKNDPKDVLGSIAATPEQIKDAWEQVQSVKLPDNYKNIKRIVINGMGGSGLGTHVLQSVFFSDLKVPLGNIHSYDIPGMVDKETLYIVSSYSGTTEEILESYKQAKKAGAKIIGLAGGGYLAKQIQSGTLPGFLFESNFNKCGEPRIGLPYSIIGMLGIFQKLNLIKVNDADIKKIILNLKKLNKNLSADIKIKNNKAKQFAKGLSGKIPVIITADFFAGNAHIIANQLNESSKNFSAYHIISELNHHLLEGLSFPKNNSRNLKFVFFNSSLNSPRLAKRVKITQDILSQQKIEFLNYNLPGNTKLEQSFSMLLFGSYLSYYLGVLNDVNPAAIPYVDYFKERLKR